MKQIKFILFGFLGIVSLLLVWGLIEPYIIDTEEEVAQIPNLPAAWQGQRIAVIADWQVGMWLDNTTTINRIVERLVEEHPALVLVIGDFIYKPGADPSPEINQAIDLVRPLSQAGITTYAVLGNHDYGMNSKQAPPNEQLAAKVQKSLEAVGVEVFQNEAIALAPPKGPNPATAGMEGVPLYLVGIGAHWPNQDKQKVALAQLPPGVPRFVMMHNPNSFEALPPRSAPVAVAGHTHGGQIRIPFTPGWSWLTFVREDKVHADGWIEGYDQPGNHLYVNRGIGFSILPLRINCPPEITLFTLQRAN